MAMLKQDIIKEIAAESKDITGHKMTVAQVDYVITAFLDKIIKYTNIYGYVKLINFGKFRIAERKAKHGRAINGEVYDTASYKTLVFKASKNINNRFK